MILMDDGCRPQSVSIERAASRVLPVAIKAVGVGQRGAVGEEAHDQEGRLRLLSRLRGVSSSICDLRLIWRGIGRAVTYSIA